ncbi:topoisomerase [Staphylococcus hominis]|uniref:topoisomerase n=1 Tax=Staphylococcus hominis TaxID=1290 RepID=UPI002739D1DF|nr:topoisomerase [Staphylococcus hominis]
MNVYNMNIEDLNQVENYIKQNKNVIMNKCSVILNKNIGMANFNGIVGGKNRTYNVRKEDYNSASEYVEAWFNNFNRLLESEKKDFDTIYLFDSSTRGERSAHRMEKLLNDEDIKDFIIVYLARTYLRNKKK